MEASKTLPSSELIAPTAVPTYGDGGVFTVIARTNIAASPISLLRIILDHSSYLKWNVFIPAIKIESEPDLPSASVSDLPGEAHQLRVGTKFTMSVNMDGRPVDESLDLNALQKTTCQVTLLEKLEDGRKGYRVAWKALGYPYLILRSERVLELVELQDGSTDFVTWETFGGVLAYVVNTLFGTKLKDRFADWARDLKRIGETEAGGHV